MEVRFLLDFDGVLFNSAHEAFTVANMATSGKEEFRQDVSYEEFLAFRSVVTDAWHYRRLYCAFEAVEPNLLRSVEPNAADWAFAAEFFAARKELMDDPQWPKSMPAYDFFYLLKPFLLKHPDRFIILSTRNVASIREAMAFHDADVIPVFGQEDIRKLGSKLEVAKAQQWLERGKHLIVYVDDMNSHLEPFEGQIHLPLHADWGYDQGTPGSLSSNQVINIISSLISLTEQQAA
nr:hypothetical protein [uncultured Sphingomonas sp.]